MLMLSFCFLSFSLAAWGNMLAHGEEFSIVPSEPDENYNEIDKPLILKTRKQNCACVNIPSDYSVYSSIENSDYLQKGLDGQISYDCSCNRVCFRIFHMNIKIKLRITSKTINVKRRINVSSHCVPRNSS